MVVSVLSCIYGKFVIPQRYILCFMTFVGVMVAYSVRVCLHMAITRMVNVEKPNKHTVCPGSKAPDKIQTHALLNWTETQQGIVLAGFFPGYVLTHVPGGMLADIFGGKHVLASGIALGALFSMLTPVAVKYGGWWALTITRFFIGIVQGPLFPSMATLLAKWIPPRERGTLVSLVTTGAQVGTIAGNLISGFLIDYGGWEFVFYFWGSLSLIWYIFFFFLCYSVPSQHPFITEEETRMLETEIGVQEKLKIPWIKILIHPPIWALVLAEIGHDWMFFLAVVELPSYVANVLRLNSKENGILNSVPYIALTICSTICGVISDILINTNRLSVITARKIFTSIGTTCPAICGVLLSFMGCHGILVGVMFVLCMVSMGPFYAGMRVNCLDITKNFAGVVMGIVNGMGSLAFIPIPCIISYSTKRYTIEEWRLVFLGLLIACIIVNIGYVIWASGDRAEWDIDPSLA